MPRATNRPPGSRVMLCPERKLSFSSSVLMLMFASCPESGAPVESKATPDIVKVLVLCSLISTPVASADDSVTGWASERAIAFGKHVSTNRSGMASVEVEGIDRLTGGGSSVVQKYSPAVAHTRY